VTSGLFPDLVAHDAKDCASDDIAAPRAGS
jgi:hypothetical protein